MKMIIPEEIFNDPNFPGAEFFDEAQGLYILRKRMEIENGMRLDSRWQHLGTMMAYVAGRGKQEQQLGLFFARSLPAEYVSGGNFVAPCEFVPLGKIFSLRDIENDLPYTPVR